MRIHCRKRRSWSLVLGVLLACLGVGALLFSACSPAESPTEPTPEVQREPPVSRQEASQEVTNTPEANNTEPAPEPTQPEEVTQPDASEPTPETNNTECIVSCGDVRKRCVDNKTAENCVGRAGCVVWEKTACKGGEVCKEGACVPQTCSGPGECEEGFHCDNGTCASNDSCCKEGAKQCTNNAAQTCEKGPDGCGAWSQGQACATGEGCFQEECKVCRHRECKGPADCCSGTSCIYNYCLEHCNTNADCASGELCFEIQTGGQKMCFPDLTEPKGAKCSIVKMCKYGLSCVPVQGVNTCLTDCNPSKGTAGNPSCETNEACTKVLNAPQGGVCVPFQGQGKKLHEACDAQNPCQAPNICVGESTNATFCLAPCDATPNAAQTCPTSDICAGYDPSDQSKGICVQRCSVPNTKDTCTYGQCRSKQNETICL
ncbi:MAG: hypothetical protein EP343_17475 [Deltaproteobacteria bacterium]|nr:MAG: hypothetical protein EP343_17475 [Deltaproteobacteria bacterium]